MATRTQIRLQQLTGELTAPEQIANPHPLSASVVEHLGDILDDIGQAVARIHGNADFTNQPAGYFKQDQFIFDGPSQLEGNAVAKGSLEVQQAAALKSTLVVDGNAELKAAASITGDASLAANLSVAGEATLASAIISDLSDEHIALAGLNGAIVQSDNLKFDAQGLVAAEAKVSNLTQTRVVLAGAAGKLEDSADLVFDADGLAVNNDFAAINIDASGNAAVGGTLSATGAATLSSTLDVTGAATMSNTLSVAENATFAKDISAVNASLSGNAAVSGDISATNATLSADLSAVKGTFSGDLAAVKGTFSSDISAVNAAFSGNAAVTGDITATKATFSSDAIVGGNALITGNLEVMGTTTTINTEEVYIEDHNVVIDSNNQEGTSVKEGAGFTFLGGTGGDLTFQWSAAHQDMELMHSGAYAKLHIGDLDAKDAALSGNLSVVGSASAASATFAGDMASATATISGNASVGGDAAITGEMSSDTAVVAGALSADSASFANAMSADSAAIANALTAGSADIAGELAAATIKIDGDVAKRLYIVDADGSMKDEAKLVFDQDKLEVLAAQHVQSYMRADSLEIKSDADSIKIDQGFHMQSSAGNFFLEDSTAPYLEFSKAGTGEAKLAANGFEIEHFDGAVATLVAKISASEMRMEAGKEIQFERQEEAIWSDSAKLNLKSGGQGYKLPSAGLPTVDGEKYILTADKDGVMYWETSSSVAASGGDASLNVTQKDAVVLLADIPLVAGVAAFDMVAKGMSTNVAEAFKEAARPGKMIDIYVNGQLLMRGANRDYELDQAGKIIQFKFPLEADDVVTVCVAPV